jgi:cytochrome c
MMKQILIAAAGLGLMASAAYADGDAAKGETVAKVCMACHSLKDKSNRVGPYLVGIVDRPIATAEGYSYSDAMKKYAADNAGGKWDTARLMKYLTDPKAEVPGTKMAFAGVKDDTKRADLVAYLATLK